MLPIISLPNYVSTLLVGGLLGIPFIVPGLWWLAIIGVGWLCHLLMVSEKTSTACGVAFVAWGIKFACALVWFWSAYPLDWVSIPSVLAQYSVISFYWLTSAVWLGCGGVVFALGVRYFTRVQPWSPYWIYLVLPLVWLLGELVAAGIFSLLTLGPGSFIQSYFSFGQIGYLLGATQLGLLIAGLGGVYSLTIVLVLVSVVLWQLLEQSLKKRALIFVLSGVGLLSAVSFFWQPQYELQNLTILSIDTQFSSSMLDAPGGYAEKTVVLETALTKALSFSGDYILLPEDSRYFSSVFGNVSPIALASQFEFTHGSTSAVIIDSGRLDLVDGQTVLRAQMYDGRTKVMHQFDKQYLVPQGEYVPYLYGGLMRLLGLGDAVQAIARNSSYSPGPLQPAKTVPAYLPGVLFCFESVRPGGVTALTSVRPLAFIAHPISHGWFHSPTIMWQQLDSMLAIQARNTGVPIVSAGNMTQAKVYLPTGEILTGKELASGNKYQVYQFEI